MTDPVMEWLPLTNHATRAIIQPPMTALQNASDNLVLADTNEGGADLQALQAQDSLAITSLSISGQIAQSVLKLFS